ncbi:MAG: DNA primase [Thermoanaerobaculia bacterium]
MTPTERVLDSLAGVRRTGPGRWLALCPAHEDRRPSLSVREGDDGRALLYCFAGCGAVEVLDSLGLKWGDLYPERLETYPKTGRGARRTAPPIPARDALEILDQEALAVAIIATRLAKGEHVAQHREALQSAAGRIGAIHSAWKEAP